MKRIIAIDPGLRQSAYVTWDGKVVWQKGLIPNEDMCSFLDIPAIRRDPAGYGGELVIEWIGHYGTGMPAGKDVFETCKWIGRFEQAWKGNSQLVPVHFVRRQTVKTHLCGKATAKDGNIIQALVDRFAPLEPNRGKGTKKAPGFFYGFKADIWQAMAVAVYWHDTQGEA